MLTNYQRMLMEDLAGGDSYGKPLIAWKGSIEFYRNAGAPSAPGSLASNLALTFVEQVYVLLQTKRSIRVYRGYETAGLKAPFGLDHQSFIRGLVASRHPGTPDGLWWTPARPTLAIDNLRLSDIHRSEPRRNSAVTLEWNRIDYYLESELPIGALVYVGRASAQQESAIYGGRRYEGGAFQFRLTAPPEFALPWMKRYAVL